MPATGSLPLFPLPGMLLYPDAVIPLHVFEPRYRQMMADMVQGGEDRMVLAALRPGFEAQYFEAPPVYEVAGVGRLMKCHRLDDGRWNIVLRGERRVRLLREVPSGRLYRRVEAMELVEPAIEEPRAAELRQLLATALTSVIGGDLSLREGAGPGYLADALLLQLPLEFPKRQALFALVDPAVRAAAVLRAFSGSSGCAGAPPGPDPERN